MDVDVRAIAGLCVVRLEVALIFGVGFLGLMVGKNKPL